MTSHQIFIDIKEHLQYGKSGKLFGADCIKALNGKAVAIFWQDKMLFKLDKKSIEFEIKNGASNAMHLYDNQKPMTGWISLTESQSSEWSRLTKQALVYMNTLKK